MLLNVNKCLDCLRENDWTLKLEHPEDKIALWYSVYTKWRRGTIFPNKRPRLNYNTRYSTDFEKMYEWV